MKKNIFKDFVWDKDGNGDYTVTYLRTGISIIVIPRLENNKYCIKNSCETEKNFYGQDIPKRYTKFEIMDILKGLTGEEKICASNGDFNVWKGVNKMEKITLDLTDYLERYPQKELESLEDYKYRIRDNLEIDYCFQRSTIDDLINAMFKENEDV